MRGGKSIGAWTVILATIALCILPATAHSKGTHFILEGGGGIGWTDSSLETTFWNATLGYGGKFKGLPFRFYLATMFDAGYFESVHSGFSRRVEDMALLFGPRIYIPVARNMRLFVQGVLGIGWARADWVVNGIENYHPRDRGLTGKVSGGFQARLARWLSLGLLFERALYWGKENDLAIPALTGLSYRADAGDQLRIGGMVVFHF